MSAPSPDRPSGPPRIDVVGGTYRELCTDPRLNALRGSGLRAAALMSSLGHRTRLHTCIEPVAQNEMTALAYAFDISLARHPRSEEVSFIYDTPVSPAQWRHPGASVAITVHEPRVVAFGMVDATWTIRADSVVLDPQHGDLSALLATIDASSVALVLNAHEARRTTGLPAAQAGLALLELDVDVVVIKQGALGGLVFQRDQCERYGPIPTTTTHTIGSGDAFTAGFASSWLHPGSSPVEAARLGSAVAAAHSMTYVPQVTPEQLRSLPAPLPHPGVDVPRIYLAAPFFSTSQRMLLETTRTALLDAGMRVFSPLHDIGIGGDEVAASDIDGLQSCHAVLALLDGADAGTVFETGWATHAAIPVVGLAEHTNDHDWTMLRGTGAQLTSDLTSAIYLAAWAALQNMTGPVT
jgi:nucleoside 2-deoxyribosyltransferase